MSTAASFTCPVCLQVGIKSNSVQIALTHIRLIRVCWPCAVLVRNAVNRAEKLPGRGPMGDGVL